MVRIAEPPEVPREAFARLALREWRAGHVVVSRPAASTLRF